MNAEKPSSISDIILDSSFQKPSDSAKDWEDRIEIAKKTLKQLENESIGDDLAAYLQLSPSDQDKWKLQAQENIRIALSEEGLPKMDWKNSAEKALYHKLKEVVNLSFIDESKKDKASEKEKSMQKKRELIANARNILSTISALGMDTSMEYFNAIEVQLSKENIEEHELIEMTKKLTAMIGVIKNALTALVLLQNSGIEGSKEVQNAINNEMNRTLSDIDSGNIAAFESFTSFLSGYKDIFQGIASIATIVTAPPLPIIQAVPIASPSPLEAAGDIAIAVADIFIPISEVQEIMDPNFSHKSTLDQISTIGMGLGKLALTFSGVGLLAKGLNVGAKTITAIQSSKAATTAFTGAEVAGVVGASAKIGLEIQKAIESGHADWKTIFLTLMLAGLLVWKIHGDGKRVVAGVSGMGALYHSISSFCISGARSAGIDIVEETV